MIMSSLLGLTANYFSRNPLPIYRRYVRPGSYEIHLQEARLLLDTQAIFVDVRATGQFQAACVPGAINLPESKIPEQYLSKLQQSEAVICYGEEDEETKDRAALLREQGIGALALAEPWQAWLAASYPITKP